MTSPSPLAEFRRHGFRPSKRYIVFQLLPDHSWPLEIVFTQQSEFREAIQPGTMWSLQSGGGHDAGARV